jgi:hypothetical protein
MAFAARNFAHLAEQKDKLDCKQAVARLCLQFQDIYVIQ